MLILEFFHLFLYTLVNIIHSVSCIYCGISLCGRRDATKRGAGNHTLKILFVGLIQ